MCSSDWTLGSLYADDQDVKKLTRRPMQRSFYPTSTLKDELLKAGQLNKEPDRRPSHNDATPESGMFIQVHHVPVLYPKYLTLSPIHQDEPSPTEPPRQRGRAKGHQQRGNYAPGCREEHDNDAQRRLQAT